MNILIAKINLPAISTWFPDAKTEQVAETRHTVTLKISRSLFDKLCIKLAEAGINRYAFMSY